MFFLSLLKQGKMFKVYDKIYDIFDELWDKKSRQWTYTYKDIEIYKGIYSHVTSVSFKHYGTVFKVSMFPYTHEVYRSGSWEKQLDELYNSIVTPKPKVIADFRPLEE